MTDRGGDDSGSRKDPPSQPSSASRPRSRRRSLTQDELSLWRMVSKSVRPIHPDAPDDAAVPSPSKRPGSPEKTAAPKDAAPNAPPAKTEHPPPPKPQRPISPPNGAKPARPLGQPNGAAPPHRRRDAASVQKLRSGVPGLDRNTARRLKRGSKDPDARIDLHGMTAARAHVALTNFILREAASGSRIVLVITGKGGRAPRDDGPATLRPIEPGRGVLKTLVPVWLTDPPLNAVIVGVYPAHISHGGEGALYVYLRKNRSG